MMIFRIVIISLLLNLLVYADEFSIVCGNGKAELVDLINDSKSKIFLQTKLKLTLSFKDTKVFVNNTELVFIGQNKDVMQFLEQVGSGHLVLYTLHKNNSILTIQKSYSLGGPIMTNMYLYCKEK